MYAFAVQFGESQLMNFNQHRESSRLISNHIFDLIFLIEKKRYHLSLSADLISFAVTPPTGLQTNSKLILEIKLNKKNGILFIYLISFKLNNFFKG